MDMERGRSSMRFTADFHIHSKYSRATSRDCIPEMLDLWARRKGLDLIGTGDFTHPAWREGLLNRMCWALRVYHRLKLGPQGPTPAQAAALSMGETLEHWYECLAYGQAKEQLEVYREKEGIEAWVEKILQP